MKLEPKLATDVPDYLARHFWWAYMWPRSAPFFDHPTVISAILFGQYRLLMNATIRRVAQLDQQRPMLQLTCVYGKLTPQLLEQLQPEPLHVTDIVPLQLDLARGKSAIPGQLLPTRMNAESLGYRDNSFSTITIFFLLHELPPLARRSVLAQALRTLRPGGTLLITEYAERPENHLFFRISLLRRILLKAEPFLGAFWNESLGDLLSELAQPLGKQVSLAHHETHFKGFYRVVEYTVESAAEDINPGG